MIQRACVSVVEEEIMTMLRPDMFVLSTRVNVGINSRGFVAGARRLSKPIWKPKLSFTPHRDAAHAALSSSIMSFDADSKA